MGGLLHATTAGKLWKAFVAGQTIPAIAAAVVGKFAFVNPIASGVHAELVSTTLALRATATAVSFGWYWTNIVTNAPTSPTEITPVNGIIGSAGTPACKVYSALTAAAGITPAIADLIVGEQSTSALQVGPVEKLYEGRIIIPPGIGIWLCGSAAGPTSGADVELDWIEWKLPL